VKVTTSGRKTSYTADDLEAAIAQADAAVQDGDGATIAEIKQELLAATGLRGVNDASLRDHVREARADLERRQNDRLVALLPSEVTDALDHALEKQRRAIRVAAGMAYAALNQGHEEQILDLEREKRSLAISLRDAQDQIDAKNASLEDALAERDGALQRISDLEAELAAARQSSSETAAGHAATLRVLDMLVDAVRGSGKKKDLQGAIEQVVADRGGE
jgi:hypothetical protein